jgi:hypothetical protein
MEEDDEPNLVGEPLVTDKDDRDLPDKPLLCVLRMGAAFIDVDASLADGDVTISELADLPFEGSVSDVLKLGDFEVRALAVALPLLSLGDLLRGDLVLS